MKISKVKELVKLGEKTSLNYFRYKENNEEIIFFKSENSESDFSYTNKNSTVNLPNDNNERVHILVAPYVGIVHFKNKINVNQSVSKEEVLLTVEAMKLFNEVKAPVSGTIVEVLIEDGDAVEYGQNLLKIKDDNNEK